MVLWKDDEDRLVQTVNEGELKVEDLTFPLLMEDQSEVLMSDYDK